MFLFKLSIYGVLNWFTWTTCKIRHDVFTIFDACIRNVKCENKNVLEVLKSLKYYFALQALPVNKIFMLDALK